jgi:hypothetical protein
MKKATKKFVVVKPRKSSAFSDFFRNTSPSEQSRVIKRVIREANKDQRKLLNQALKLSPQPR